MAEGRIYFNENSSKIVFRMLIITLHGSIEHFRLEGTFVDPLVQLPPQSGAGFVIITVCSGPGSLHGH